MLLLCHAGGMSDRRGNKKMRGGQRWPFRQAHAKLADIHNEIYACTHNTHTHIFTPPTYINTHTVYAVTLSVAVTPPHICKNLYTLRSHPITKHPFTGELQALTLCWISVCDLLEGLIFLNDKFMPCDDLRNVRTNLVEMCWLATDL